ncbi:TolC family protein [Burkholderia lata]|uniref:TolC family protein n=1 Tax=Burkholderia lata (strain ATCC 17760 / DSM 23089 / LMG 22485 / NCIMB 9086 / R18194 / 383) TaxID=482957 RepID=UPI001582BA33
MRRSRQVQRRARLNVENSYQAMRSATQTLEQSESPLELAGHSHSAAQKRYRIGVGNTLELPSAHPALANAKKQRMQSHADWRSA